MTRGIRNFNPGNIRRVPSVKWEGESPDQSTDSAFVVFSSPEYGIRAIARILRSYAKRGLNTIDEVINRWAPPTENNAEAYVAAVCNECGVGPDDVISLEAMMPAVIKAIIRHENGGVPYTPQQIYAGISLA